MVHQFAILPKDWEFNRGNEYHWIPFGINLRLIQIESGMGQFVQVKDGSLVDGAEIHEWPLDQYILQGVHIKRLPVRL